MLTTNRFHGAARRTALAGFILSLLGTVGAAHAASLTSGGYTESFDELGTGTSLSPASGWAVYYDASGGTNTAWNNTTGIPSSGSPSVASLTLSSNSNSLAAAISSSSSFTSSTKNTTEAYNIAVDIANSGAASTDRALATSPTQEAGIALQLTLANTTGSALSSFNISYDIDRFTSVSTANELPGYWLFYSTNGSTWTNVSALNPSITTVPNSVGVTTESGTVNLGSSVANGSNIYLRWVDDDASQTSPDQIIGLNNVDITPVPLPASAWFMLAGIGGLGACARRRGFGGAAGHASAA